MKKKQNEPETYDPCERVLTAVGAIGAAVIIVIIFIGYLMTAACDQGQISLKEYAGDVLILMCAFVLTLVGLFVAHAINAVFSDYDEPEEDTVHTANPRIPREIPGELFEDEYHFEWFEGA